MIGRHGLIAFVLSSGFVLSAAMAPIVGAQAQGQPLTLNLTAQNNSGISGMATLTDLGGGRTRVEIRVNNAGPGPQPAHIHPGSCAQLDPTPLFALTSVSNGTSTTEVNTGLQQLTSSPTAVHLHKSQDELTVYVACADVSRSGAPGTLPRSGDGSSSNEWLAVMAALVGAGLAGLGLLMRRIARRSA
jgi:hypothetical protein